MSTTIEMLIVIISIACILSFAIFGDRILKNIYFNIIILMLVSGFIGYELSTIEHKMQWYSIALIGVMGYGMMNVMGRIGRMMREEK
jgi:hypothetical protein